MRAILAIALGLAVLWPVAAIAKGVRVNGYVKKDGTYVAPHYRSSPNGSTLDNYSARGNSNPYTGEAGKRDPYALPAARSEYTTGYAPVVPAAVMAPVTYPPAATPSESTSDRLVRSDGAWPKFDAPGALSQDGREQVDDYSQTSRSYLTAASGSLCNEFLLAADEMARAAETLAKCASRMDPRQTCAVEADDSVQASIRYQVAASKAQSYCSAR